MRATIDRLRSAASVTLGEGVDRRHLDGQVDAADAGELGGQHEQIGRLRERRQRPREQQREREAGRRSIVEVVELHDLVLEAEQRPWVDVEREVEVDRAAARLLGMEVDLPQLAQRVGLDEMALVVDVEAVVDRLTLHVGDESCDVDDCHTRAFLFADACRRLVEVTPARE